MYFYSSLGYLLWILSIKLGTGDLAKYPFLNEASNYIRDTHFDFEELNRPEIEHIIYRAAKKIDVEITKGIIYEELEKYEVEILTFLITLIMVKSIGLELVLKKHSLLEAIRAEKFLIEDLKREKNQQKRRLLLFKIFEDLFKFKVDIDSENHQLFKVKVTDYLERAVQFHEQEWKLINRLVHKGYVYLDADETVRLIRSELSTLIYNRVKSMTFSSLPKAIKSRVDELSIKFKPMYEVRRIYTTTDYPPCIKHALDVMAIGENLSHSGRVMLATYMLAIGKSVEEVSALFHKAPDYNEETTRYQVEHLAGSRGSRIKYSVPSCKKLLNENLCFATEKCNGIINPIQFGRNK